VFRSHSARWARRSSGVIFPAIVFLFLAEQAIELCIDVHQHSNDAIDGLPVEGRSLLSSPHLDRVSALPIERKISTTG
jgi:hypothetical protein